MQEGALRLSKTQPNRHPALPAYHDNLLAVGRVNLGLGHVRLALARRDLGRAAAHVHHHARLLLLSLTAAIEEMAMISPAQLHPPASRYGRPLRSRIVNVTHPCREGALMPLAVEGGITGIRKACVATREQNANTEDSLIVPRSCAISHDLWCLARGGAHRLDVWSNGTL